MASSSFSWSGIPWTTPGQDNSQFLMLGRDLTEGLGSLANNQAPNLRGPGTPNPFVMGPFGQIMGMNSQLQASGNAAVAAGQGGANQVYGLGNQLTGLASQMQGEFNFNLPYAQTALTDAFDPMKTQHDYYAQQVRDATGAQEAAAGLGATPYGAAETGVAQASFENAWQMNKLQREQMGASTATGLENQVLQAQMGAGQLIDAAGQLDLGATRNLLQAYGIQGDDLAKAMNALVGLISAQRTSISESSSGGGGGGGGGGDGGPGINMNEYFGGQGSQGNQGG